MTLLSPLHELTQKAGAVFVDEAGWQMPAHFGDPLAEYRAAREAAVLFDLSQRGKIAVCGKDAVAWLQNLSTNDIRNLAPEGCEAFLTNHKAKAVAYMYVRRFNLSPDEFLLLDLDPGLVAKVLQHLNKYIISEDVELSDRTQEWAQLHLGGAQALSVCEKVLERLKKQNSSGGPVSFRRDALALPGYDIFCPPAAAPEVWDLFLAAGARPAGLEAQELLRVEAGLPVFGKDIDDERFVVEVNRIPQTICYTKGCYLGQEPIVMARDRGHVNRKLLGIVIEHDRAVAAGTKLFAQGQEAGQVTSSVVSPRLGKAIALAYVRRGHETLGTKLELEIDGSKRTAAVVALPFAG